MKVDITIQGQVRDVGDVRDADGEFRPGVLVRCDETSALAMIPLTADQARAVGGILFRKAVIKIVMEEA